jgi:hypothetical protein
MTDTDAQEPAEVTCANCQHVFISNLGTTVLVDATTATDGTTPYLHFCSPQCETEWQAKHSHN